MSETTHNRRGTGTANLRLSTDKWNAALKRFSSAKGYHVGTLEETGFLSLNSLPEAHMYANIPCIWLGVKTPRQRSCAQGHPGRR